MGRSLAIEYVGHATLLVEVDTVRFLTDPALERRIDDDPRYAIEAQSESAYYAKQAESANSLYILVIGIAGAGLGPVIMGRVTDSVFGDPMKIHYSMALVTLVMGVLGVGLIAYGLKSYRDSLTRVTWA